MKYKLHKRSTGSYQGFVLLCILFPIITPRRLQGDKYKNSRVFSIIVHQKLVFRSKLVIKWWLSFQSKHGLTKDNPGYIFFSLSSALNVPVLQHPCPSMLLAPCLPLLFLSSPQVPISWIFLYHLQVNLPQKNQSHLVLRIKKNSPVSLRTDQDVWNSLGWGTATQRHYTFGTTILLKLEVEYCFANFKYPF